MRYAARTDANHSAIADALRKAGVLVVDTSRVGGGFPDFVCAKAGVIYLVEAKDGAKPPSARKLTPAEADFLDRCKVFGVTVHVVTSATEALAAVGVEVAA